MARFHVVTNAQTGQTVSRAFSPAEEAAANIAEAAVAVPKRDLLAELDALKAVLVAKGQVTAAELKAVMPDVLKG